jgi:hypothetical protein
MCIACDERVPFQECLVCLDCMKVTHRCFFCSEPPMDINDLWGCPRCSLLHCDFHNNACKADTLIKLGLRKEKRSAYQWLTDVKERDNDIVKQRALDEKRGHICCWCDGGGAGAHGCVTCKKRVHNRCSVVSGTETARKCLGCRNISRKCCTRTRTCETYELAPYPTLPHPTTTTITTIPPIPAPHLTHLDAISCTPCYIYYRALRGYRCRQRC